MVHQGRRYFSKRSQCLCVLLFIASLISYVDAVQVEKVQNKQEAIQACDQSHQYDNSETYQRVIPLYQTIDDNDVFMDCQGNEEHITEFNRKTSAIQRSLAKPRKKAQFTVSTIGVRAGNWNYYCVISAANHIANHLSLL